MSATDLTVEETTNSLTGFDEIAIEKAFGFDPYADAERKPMLLMRALVFVDQRRKGNNDAESKQHALSLSLKDLNEYFADAPDDAVPSDPDSDAGKDD